VQGSSRLDRESLDARALVGHLVPAGSVFAFLAEHRGELFPDAVLADLFASSTGRPSVPADVVAAVIVLVIVPVGMNSAERGGNPEDRQRGSPLFGQSGRSRCRAPAGPVPDQKHSSVLPPSKRSVSGSCRGIRRWHCTSGTCRRPAPCTRARPDSIHDLAASRADGITGAVTESDIESVAYTGTAAPRGPEQRHPRGPVAAGPHDRRDHQRLAGGARVARRNLPRRGIGPCGGRAAHLGGDGLTRRGGGRVGAVALADAAPPAARPRRLPPRPVLARADPRPPARTGGEEAEELDT
jgi:hypothetical protein